MKYIYLFLGIVMMCCVTKARVEDNRNPEIARVDSILDNFSPVKQLIGNRGTDQNSLLFKREAGWDTTYVLVIRKDSSSITAIYQGFSPHYSETTAFYEGFAFELNPSTWERVITEADKLLDTLNHKPYTDCVDCSTYTLSHNSKLTRMNKSNRAEFEKYERFLWQTLIYPVLKRKRELSEAQPK